MGLYDSIYLDVTCPGCGEESMMECQTKDLECEMNEYFRGDFVLSKKLLTEMTETKKLYCTAECKSMECSKKANTLNRSYFTIYVILRGGSITGEYINIGEA